MNLGIRVRVPLISPAARRILSRWRSGDASGCNPEQAGSIPALDSRCQHREVLLGAVCIGSRLILASGTAAVARHTTCLPGALASACALNSFQAPPRSDRHVRSAA